MASTTLQNDSALRDGNGRLARPGAAARLFSQFNRTELEGFIAVAIGALDAIDGDPEVEADDPSEDNGDGELSAWLERIDQTRAAYPSSFFARVEGTEDDEEDSEDCDGFENEPMFDRRGCARLNRFFGDGPGGGQALDSDREEVEG